MGIKERRTKILLALVLLSDVNLDYVTFDDKLQKVFDLTFNQKTRGTISALLKEGLIEKRTENNQQSAVNNGDNTLKEGPEPQIVTSGNVYRLTVVGFNSLALKFPFF